MLVSFSDDVPAVGNENIVTETDDEHSGKCNCYNANEDGLSCDADQQKADTPPAMGIDLGAEVKLDGTMCEHQDSDI